jgi:hypothetical protein
METSCGQKDPITIGVRLLYYDMYTIDFKLRLTSYEYSDLTFHNGGYTTLVCATAKQETQNIDGF